MSMTREEVVRGLEKIGVFFKGRFDMAVGDGKMLLGNWMSCAEEAAQALREMEPRVMTVEELCRARGKPAWFEARNGRLYTGWVIIYDVQTGMGITGTRVGVTEPGHVTIWPNVELYGKKWRCWTGEPTEEQRRATAWN